MAVSSRRRESDIMKLMMSDYNVEMEDDGSSFIVDFAGPDDTYYEGGLWKVQVTLPKDYPYRSPSIGFKNRLYHPNVDEMSGSVCLDVINQTWSPMYDLLNIFDMFLPQLLSYPNASDPLNSEAAGLMLHDLDKYQVKVRDYVKRFAAPPDPAALALAKKRRHLSTDSSVSGSTVCSSATSVTFSSSSSSSSSSASEVAATAAHFGGSVSSQVDGSGKRATQNVCDEQDDDLSSLSGGSDGEGDDDLVLDL